MSYKFKGLNKIIFFANALLSAMAAIKIKM